MEFTNAELETFARGTEVFMAILDEEGVFLKANVRWTQRFDYTIDQLIGTSIFELIHELEVGEFEIILNQAKEHGQECHKIVTMIGRELAAHSFQFDLTYTNNNIYLVGFDVTDHAREHVSLIDMSRLSKTGAWYYDPIRDKTYWTEEVYRIHELDPNSEMDAEKALRFYTEDYKEKIEQLVNELYADHKSYEFAGEIVTAKGNKKWIRTIAKPMVQDDKIIYICGVTVDQTRLHRNLEKIKHESETRMLALKGIKSALFDYDVETDMMFINPDFREDLGLPTDVDRLKGSEIFEWIHPDDRAATQKKIEEDLLKSDNYHENQYRLRKKDGSYEHYEVYGWMKRDKNGKTTRMVGNLINVNKKVLAEQEKERVKNCLEAMVNNGYIYSMLLDSNGVILMADQQSLAIIQHDFSVDPTKEEVKYIDVMPDIFKKPFLEEFNKALQGETIRKEVERPLLEGSMQWLDVMYHPIKDEEGNVIQVLTNLLDITERKRAEISIRDAGNQAQALSRLKSGILSNMSHEMRTPLNGIMGVTNLMLNQDFDDDVKEMLNMQHDSEKRLLKTLSDLITLSDLDAMRLNMRLKQHNINDLAQTCFDMYNHQAKMKKLDFVLEKSEVEGIMLVDYEMIQAALAAIVNNALKYTSEGSVKIVCCVDEQENGEIRIVDTGIGIEEESRERIFENFEVANFGLNLKYEGAGIGLSIAKKFIQLMGGSVELESVVGEGSEFIVRLPVISDI
ncbi:PAS domain-containing sensor histidine kinase [Ekhidna sp.]